MYSYRGNAIKNLLFFVILAGAGDVEVDILVLFVAVCDLEDRCV